MRRSTKCRTQIESWIFKDETYIDYQGDNLVFGIWLVIFQTYLPELLKSKKMKSVLKNLEKWEKRVSTRWKVMQCLPQCWVPCKILSTSILKLSIGYFECFSFLNFFMLRSQGSQKITESASQIWQHQEGEARRTSYWDTGFLPGIFSGKGGKIYCYANFFCYANFSFVFGANFREAKVSGRAEVSEGGKLPQGAPPCLPVEESQDTFSNFIPKMLKL